MFLQIEMAFAISSSCMAGLCVGHDGQPREPAVTHGILTMG